MFARLREKTVGFHTEKPYYEKFFILNPDVLYFRTFMDNIKFYEVAHSIFNKVTLPEKLKKDFFNILSMLSSCKDLYIEDFNRDTKLVDLKEYSERVQKVINSFGNPYFLEKEYVTVLEVKKTSAEEIDQYKEKSKYPSKVLLYSNESPYLNIVVPKELYDRYYKYIIGIQEKITGDFYTDLFLSLIDEMPNIKLSRTCPNFNYPLITEQGVHESVAVAINYAVQTLSYLKNCTSFRTGKLEVFDELEISNRISTILTFLKRAVSQGVLS